MTPSKHPDQVYQYHNQGHIQIQLGSEIGERTGERRKAKVDEN